VALLCLVFIACGSGDSSEDEPYTAAATPTPAAFPFSYTDSSGTTLTFKEPAKRIISYSPGATETLFAIGAGAQVVATDRFSDFPAEVSALPKLEYSRPAPEPALALTPDLIIMASRQEGQVEQFRAANLKVLFLREPEDVDGVVDHIALLGRITGQQAKAESLATDMDKRIATVREKMAKVDKGPVVFYEVSPDGYSSAPDTFVGSLLKLTKAGNVAQGATTAFPQLSAEVVINANPDVILLSDAGQWGGQTLATVRERPGWSGIKAVSSGRVYEVDSSVFNRPGPRVIEALEQLVKLLYPSL
jgi:iron complex transport system substrate-binding protein